MGGGGGSVLEDFELLLSYLIVFYRSLSVGEGWVGVGLGSGAKLTDLWVWTRGAFSGIVIRQIKMYIGERTLWILLTIVNFIF